MDRFSLAAVQMRRRVSAILTTLLLSIACSDPGNPSDTGLFDGGGVLDSDDDEDWETDSAFDTEPVPETDTESQFDTDPDDELDTDTDPDSETNDCVPPPWGQDGMFEIGHPIANWLLSVIVQGAGVDPQDLTNRNMPLVLPVVSEMACQ